ncbi:D-xylose 1-dehydrogenase (NADP(+)) 2 [Grifola frondosa]|uniref:D-xylose 1-dehydrogenase (NADP(+), D-xylono-1,5-lactone-forming) n=1 Tax=Grifola frondosa TaxID=5627 RepID=A0A1C7MIA0_GRIFR|nr:D-xylose 1-dehydrogenase (NADP(+)) 2 [Grifola frondosa]
MFSLISFVKRVNKGNNPPLVEKASNPLRFGVLGAARIAPDAIIKPARCHDDVEVIAVAARNKDRADEFAKKWDLPKSYGGATAYQDLLDDGDIDAVYIGLPNSLHFEWTMKALALGKHVLCEKPIADNEEETRKMFAFAEEKNLILLEAWQVRFHPAIQRVKAIVEEGSLGKMVSMTTHLGVWNSVFFVKDDIRFNYSLGGGGLMDMGPYPINCMRYLASCEPVIDSAEAICRSENIDRRIETHMTFGALPATIITDSAMEGWGPFQLIPQWIKMVLRVDCEEGAVEIRNYVLPHVWHSITVLPKNGKPRVEKAYKPLEGKGEEWWSAYRYQLEAFMDKVRGRKPQAWRSAEDSISSMHIIDTIYTKCGLALRPNSEFKL